MNGKAGSEQWLSFGLNHGRGVETFPYPNIPFQT